MHDKQNPPMDQEELLFELTLFFKATADLERIKILGLLANEAFTPAELARHLKLKPAAIPRHLDQLAQANLVIQEGETYRLDKDALEAKKRRLLSWQRPRLSPDDFEGEDFEHKVLANFSNADGSFKSLPMQHKKLLVLLRQAQYVFEPGVRYSEKQVNQLLRRFFEDTASLRRYLVDNGLLARDKGEYWLVLGEDSPPL